MQPTRAQERREVFGAFSLGFAGLFFGVAAEGRSFVPLCCFIGAFFLGVSLTFFGRRFVDGS